MISQRAIRVGFGSFFAFYTVAPALWGNWARVPERLIMFFVVGGVLLVQVLSVRRETRRVQRLAGGGVAFAVSLDAASREALRSVTSGEALPKDEGRFYFVVFDDRLELWAHSRQARKLRTAPWANLSQATVESTQEKTLAIDLHDGRAIVVDLGFEVLSVVSESPNRDQLVSELQYRLPATPAPPPAASKQTPAQTDFRLPDPPSPR